ncbi:MAG: OmpA family protein [Chitinophagaceae bacterium]
MAKNCFLLVLLFTASASFAQVKIGLLGGLQSTNITETNSLPDWDSTTGKYYKSKSGIHVGLAAEIPVTRRIFFEPAILYSQKGRNFTKILETTVADSFYSFNTTRQLSIQYFDIPLNFAYKLPLSRKKGSNFIISAGPYMSLFFNGKKVTNQNDEFTSIADSKITRVSKTEDLEVGKKDDSYRTFGYGVNARAGFEFGNVTLTGFYAQGLDNLYYAAYEGSFKHKIFGASLGIWLGEVKEPIVVKDKDNDGVVDAKDACPLLAGPAITGGCPDKDGDGIADNRDKCPDSAGIARYEGCPVPDTDGDGVNDEADKCPSVSGLVKYNGCPVPDTDNDGINDEADKCPTVAGVAAYNGCPVPDRDHDGVADQSDKCPDQAGSAANDGCPVIQEAIKEQVNFAAENIFFSTNSAQLLTKSFKPLETVAGLLKTNPELLLSVDGYTDNTGTAAANLAVSAKRATAVRDFLVKNGVEPERITINGYGQASPVADNSTAAGRSKNRRVELKLNNK